MLKPALAALERGSAPPSTATALRRGLLVNAARRRRGS